MTGQLEGAPEMLVLSRHRDEKIIIGDNIIVTVVDIRRDRVRLGITAPAHIPVHREEVYEAIQREQRERARRQAAAQSKAQTEQAGSKPESQPEGAQEPNAASAGPEAQG
jgi:carbon storage regulator